MADLYQLSDLSVLIGLALGLVLVVAVLILFGYWLGRKTVTEEPMIPPGIKSFNPGPVRPVEKSELDDAMYSPDDYEKDFT